MFLFVLIFLLCFLLTKQVNKKIIFFEVILLVILITFSGLRYNVGTDYNLYSNIFNGFRNISESSTARTGILFSYLIYFVKFIINQNYYFLIFICSFITILLFYRYFKKISDSPGTAILLFLSLGFYAASMNIFRQFLSMSFLIWGNYFFVENKNKKYQFIFPWIISFLIHNVSIIGIIGCIIVKLFNKKTKFPYKTILLLSLICLLFLNSILPYILGNISSLELYIGKTYEPGIGTYLMVLCYILIYIILIFSRKKLILYNSTNEIYYRFVTIGMFFMILEFQNHLFYRIALYFIIYFVCLLTDYLSILKQNNKKELVFLFYIVCFIYFMVYINSFGNVIPYNWVI